MWESLEILNVFITLTLKQIFNFITNRIGSTKWTFHKEQSFAINYFIFLNLFQYKNIL